MKLIFYDFENLTKIDWWMVVFIDYETRKKTIIINNREELSRFYVENKDNIFIGYNSRGYDQWVLKAILLGKNPSDITEGIIEKGKNGYQVLKEGTNIKLNNYDLSNGMRSLKEYEGFMGSRIKESSVPFDIDRPLKDEEVEELVEYCTHDVEETIKVFEHKKSDFDSQLLLIESFNLGMDMFNKTKAQLSAHILDTVKQESIDDEFNIKIPDTLRLNKYRYVEDWYRNPRNWTYKRELNVDVQGCPTVFAWGGVHGARRNYAKEGIILCFDVASLYPSLMIEYDCLSRNVLNPEKYAHMKAERLKLKKLKDPKEKALKLVLNSTYGILKDRNNPFYDPRMANQVCISGQLLILDLVEKVEHLGEIIQLNTDGVYMLVNNMEVAEEIKSIAAEWERRTRLELEWSVYDKIFQRDVNNYILVKGNKTKSKGCVKEKVGLDYDLPIITKAIIDYCAKGTPIKETIYNCNDLMEFQKIVKISSLYKFGFHGEVVQDTKTKKFEFKDGVKFRERVLRVFASNLDNAKGVYKIKGENKCEKIANTPEKCFIYNDNVIGVGCLEELDKDYYVALAEESLNDFLGVSSKKETDKLKNERELMGVLSRNYKRLYDVFEDIKINTKLTQAVLEKFIKIGVFDRYGNSNKVLTYYRLFKLLYGKKSIKEDKLIDVNYEIKEVLKKCSEYKEDKKQFANLDSSKFLSEIDSYIKVEDIPITIKIRQEHDLYNDVTIKDSSLADDILYILNVNETKNPSIIAYNVKHGTVGFIKIKKETFNILEIKERDFIKAVDFSRVGVVESIGKSKDGVNKLKESETNLEWFLNVYEILDRDYSKHSKMEVGD